MPPGVDGRPWAAAAIAGLLAFSVYLPSAFQNAFVEYDDPAFITQEPQVARGLTVAGVWWALTSTDQINYIPITRLSFLIDASLFGVEDATGHHVVSAVIHGLNAALLCLLFARVLAMLGRRGKEVKWLPALLAVVWALHPLEVEAVSWASSRKHLLAFAFGVGSLLIYFGRGQTKGGYAMALLAFALSLGSKATFAAVPLLLVAWDRRGRGLDRRRSALRALPFATLSAAVALASSVAMDNEANTVLLPRAAEAVMAAPGDLAAMLGRTFAPFGLACHYPRRTGVTWLEFGLLAAVAAALASGVWTLRGRWPGVAMGFAWFVLLWLPVSGVIPFGDQASADRLMYAALPGLVFSLGHFVRGAWLAAPVVVAAILVPMTLRQAGTWRDTLTLFEHAAAAGGASSATVQFQLSLEYARRGQGLKSMAALRSAVAAEPRYPQARHNLAAAAMRSRRPAEALEHARVAVEGLPRWAEAHLVLANALYETGDPSAALKHYLEAARLDPAIPTAAANAKALRDAGIEPAE